MSNEIFASNGLAEDYEIAEKELENARNAHQRYLIKQQDEDWNTAIESYVKAAKYNPEIPEAYYRLAFLMWEKGEIDVEMAIEQCKMALKYSPNSPNACIYKGYFDKIANNYADAEKEFKKAIELTGFKSARPRILLAMSILRRMNEQKTSFKDVLSFIYYFISGSLMLSYDIPSLKFMTQSIKDDFAVLAYEKTGIFLERLKMSNAAYKLYSKAVKNTGHKEVFFAKMGDISVRKKDADTAYDCYREAYLSNPNDKVVLMKLATVTQTYFPDMVDEAIDYYNKLLEIEETENCGFIYYELGHLYLKKGDKVNSISAFNLALKSECTNPFYHNSLAYAYLKAGLYEDAIEHYNSAISINPDNEWTAIVCHALGSTYAEIFGNLESAIDKFKEGIELDPKNYDLKLSLGDALVTVGDMDNAIRSYCDAIQVEPDNFRAYSKVGMALWERDLVEESIVAYHKAIELNPNYDIAQNNLGVIYLDALEAPVDALPFFEKAIEVNPSYTLAYFNAGRCHEMIGSKTQAAQYYQMALDMNKLTEDLNESEIQERLHSLFEI